MKTRKFTYLIPSLVIAALSTGFSACTVGDQYSDRESDVPIMLEPEVEIATKAYEKGEINTEADMRDGWVGFAAYNVFSSTNQYNHKTYFSPGDRGASYQYSGGKWKVRSGVPNWPADSRKLNFYAYFPLSINIVAQFASSDNNADGIVMSVSNWPDGTDLLVGASLDQSRAPITPITFKHAFAKVDAVNFKIPDDSNLTFHIKEIEFTNTHCETDVVKKENGAFVIGNSAKVQLKNDGTIAYVNGVQKNRKVTLATEEKINKERVQAAAAKQGYIPLVKKGDNAFFLPVGTSAIWDGSAFSNFPNNYTCVHLKAKVKQGEETILQGSGEYVIGSETQYGDIYIPIKGSSNKDSSSSSLALEAGHRYTVNIYLKSGVGYNKDGKVYQPINLDVSVDEWVENEVTVGQVTVANDNIVLNYGNNWTADIVINAGHKELSKIAVTPSDNLTAAKGTDSKGELIVTIGRKDGATAGSGSVIVTDHETNSMATIAVTIE